MSHDSWTENGHVYIEVNVDGKSQVAHAPIKEIQELIDDTRTGPSFEDQLADLTAQLAESREALAAASKLWDGPETEDWLEGVRKEAAHQKVRWGIKHDAEKQPEEWFWLLGYLAGKALAAEKAGDMDKARHHTISSAAALLNWHESLS